MEETAGPDRLSPPSGPRRLSPVSASLAERRARMPGKEMTYELGQVHNCGNDGRYCSISHGLVFLWRSGMQEIARPYELGQVHKCGNDGRYCSISHGLVFLWRSVSR